MIVIVCVDEDMGMSFNNRRQSRDRVLSDHILRMASGCKLWMSPYSETLFEQDENTQLVVRDSFLLDAGVGEYAFVERESPLPFLQRIESLIIFRWNRKYPSDLKLNIDFSKWTLQSSTEFQGSSHDKITEEVYRKPEKEN